MKNNDIDLNNFNPNEIGQFDDLENFEQTIHIRIRQRNRRQSVTIIENVALVKPDDSISDEEFSKKLTKVFRKMFGCSVCIKNNNMELFGDHREEIKEYFIKNKLSSEEHIKIHGF